MSISNTYVAGNGTRVRHYTYALLLILIVADWLFLLCLYILRKKISFLCVHKITFLLLLALCSHRLVVFHVFSCWLSHPLFRWHSMLCFYWPMWRLDAWCTSLSIRCQITLEAVIVRKKGRNCVSSACSGHWRENANNLQSEYAWYICMCLCVGSAFMYPGDDILMGAFSWMSAPKTQLHKHPAAK